MVHNFDRFAGDVHADAGFWSPQTSITNFCEEDYAITLYIAEFINSLSNLAYIYLALQQTNWNPRRLDQMSASLLLVGITSTFYHASLRLLPQFCDEVSMHFLAGALLQRLLCTHQAQQKSRSITATIYTTIGTMSAIYIRSGNLNVHMALFLGLLLLIGVRTVYLINQRRDRARLWWRFGRVCAYLSVGFALWNVDLTWCQELRRLRERVGLPWAWGLEMHGWWHVLTALGAAKFMKLVGELCP